MYFIVCIKYICILYFHYKIIAKIEIDEYILDFKIMYFVNNI